MQAVYTRYTTGGLGFNLGNISKIHIVPSQVRRMFQGCSYTLTRRRMNEVRRRKNVEVVDGDRQAERCGVQICTFCSTQSETLRVSEASRVIALRETLMQEAAPT